MTRTKYLLLSLGIILVITALSEFFVQASGVLDFPLYDANNQIGYIPRPNQRGSFLHLHDFEFNEISMGTGTFAPSTDALNILLVGDSIVLGGNPYSQRERLGTQLALLSSWTVWPISAGSWALQNELEYLREHPKQVFHIDTIVFVLNSGDFDAPSSWQSELTHPRRRPFPGLLYVFRKYVHAITPTPETPPELMVKPRDWRNDLAQFASGIRHPIYIVLYPDREEMTDESKRRTRLDSHVADLKHALGNHGEVTKIAECPSWNARLYRDDIHPTVAGTTELAKIIKNAILGKPCSK